MAEFVEVSRGRGVFLQSRRQLDYNAENELDRIARTLQLCLL